MGGNQVKQLGFSPETVITEELIERLWAKYNKDASLKHDAATSLLRDLLKVYGIPFNKPAVKSWLASNGLPPGSSVDRPKFSSLFLTRARQENISMSDILTLEAEVQSRGGLFFEVPLENSWKRTQETGEPHLTTKLIASLRRRAMEEEGLFRLAGNQGEIRRVRLLADCGRSIDFDQCPIHDISSLLKIFYRVLPEPIIPFESYEAVIAASRETDDDDHSGLVFKLQKFVDGLPPVNSIFLKELFEFMNVVASHSEINKMSLRNLVIVMAPNLLRARNPTVEKTMADYNHVNRAIQTLVSENHTIFVSASSDSSAASQPVSPSATASSSVAPSSPDMQDEVAESDAYVEASLPPSAAPVIKTAVVLWDFDGMAGSGLCVRAGDQVEVISDDQSEWIYCRMGPEQGYVPKNYLNFLSDM